MRSDEVVAPPVRGHRRALLAMWCLSRATPRGQPWTPAVTLPHGRNGLSVRRMAVLSTFREPSLCRQVHRELMRNAVLDLTPIIPTTACHQRNYIERYSRYKGGTGKTTTAVNVKQPPQSTRRNTLPVKRIDGALLMGHEYLACALV